MSYNVTDIYCHGGLKNNSSKDFTRRVGAKSAEERTVETGNDGFIGLVNIKPLGGSGWAHRSSFHCKMLTANATKYHNNSNTNINTLYYEMKLKKKKKKKAPKESSHFEILHN